MQEREEKVQELTIFFLTFSIITVIDFFNLYTSLKRLSLNTIKAFTSSNLNVNDSMRVKVTN